MNTNTATRILAVVLPCCLLLPVSVQAQPDLNFKRVRLAWPNVEVYFSVGCNGIKNYQLKPSDVRLYEDGTGAVWIGLRGDSRTEADVLLTRWTSDDEPLRNYSVADGLPPDFIPGSFVEDHSGGLWIGSRAGGREPVGRADRGARADRRLGRDVGQGGLTAA